MAGSDEHEVDSDGAAPGGGSSRPMPSNSLRARPPEDLARILGLLTHDLRNPLAALSSNIGFLQMLEGELSGETFEAVQDLVLSVEALGRIIDGMELVGHDLADRPPGRPTTLTVASLVRSVQGHAERGAQSHGVKLEWELAGCEELRVLAIEQPFLIALSALVHNAITVAPARSTVSCRLESEGSNLSFSVLDDGPELAPDLRERALLAQAQPDIKGERSARYSRGLGLYTVARAAWVGGAEFRVGSRPAGSLLSLVVPLAP